MATRTSIRNMAAARGRDATRDHPRARIVAALRELADSREDGK